MDTDRYIDISIFKKVAHKYPPVYIYISEESQFRHVYIGIVLLWTQKNNKNFDVYSHREQLASHTKLSPWNYNLLGIQGVPIGAIQHIQMIDNASFHLLSHYKLGKDGNKEIYTN